MKIKQLPIYPLILSLLLTGCTTGSVIPPVAGTETPPLEAGAAPAIPESTLLPDNVNEAGRIPVLMYHRIADSASEYDRTAEQFRSDLERLYAEGYRPISLKDFVAGHIDIPVGCSPVVITFDDGDKTQYTAAEGGVTPTDDCALGIMEAFRAEHPEFNPQATFFVNGGVPFGQRSILNEKLKYLLDRGYTIGNHTWGHENLSKLTADEVQTAVGRNAAALEKLTGQPVTLLALPFGIRPKTPEPMAAVVTGTWEGVPYNNLGIMNVGWQPELPAYIIGFDAAAINRVRSGDDKDEAGDWLTRLAAQPENRYISDGDAKTVTVPATLADRINPEALGEKILRVLE